MGLDPDDESASVVAAPAAFAWPIEPPALSDGSLTLRPWRAADADAVFAACQDAEVQRWMDVPVPFLHRHAVEFVGEHARRQWLSRRGSPFAITDAHDDRVLGSCGLVAVDPDDLIAQVPRYRAVRPSE